jgi:glycosyltransferase involved in cell wall biosynthesis
LIVGAGHLPQTMNDLLYDNSLFFTHAVSDVKPWYNMASVAVVPLLNGSGTRLKILEAMGLGIPVVSTSIGAEGIEYADGHDILIADNEIAFAEKVVHLLSKKEQRLRLQQNARTLVKEKYDWNIIGDSMEEILN